MVGALSYSPWELTLFLELPYCTQGQTPVPRNGPGPSLRLFGPEALVTPSSQDPVGAQGTIMTFERPLLGLFFGTLTQSQFYCLCYWLEGPATCCPQAYWLGSYGAPKEP